MNIALEEAKAAGLRKEVPIGAVLVINNHVIARSGNCMQERCDPTAHAEIRVITESTHLLQKLRIPEADLYVTLEPCAMCAAAISFARIRRLYFGATDEKGGAVISGVRFFTSPSCHHKPEVYSGIAEQESSRLLKKFFHHKR